MKTFEIIEVVVLAIVAIATAWSGYQATKWDGQQSLLYGQASRDRFQADAASTYGGQLLSADASFFTAWLQAHSTNDSALQRSTYDGSAPTTGWVQRLAGDRPVHEP